MSIDLDDLARLEAAATKGPWSAAPDPDGPSSIMCEGPAHMNLIGEVGSANADFIVAIRNAAPALITAAREAERMRAVVDAARAFSTACSEEQRYGRECVLVEALAALDGGSK